jgi:hypothetical protein
MKTVSKLFLISAIFILLQIAFNLFETYSGLYNAGYQLPVASLKVIGYFCEIILLAPLVAYLVISPSSMPLRKFIILFVLIRIVIDLVWEFYYDGTSVSAGDSGLWKSLHFMQMVFDIALFYSVFKYSKRFSVIWVVALLSIIVTLLRQLWPLFRIALRMDSIDFNDYLFSMTVINNLELLCLAIMFFCVAKFLKPLHN